MVLECEREPVSTCGGAMLDAELQLPADATHIEVRVTPGVEFGRATQSLPTALVGGALRA